MNMKLSSLILVIFQLLPNTTFSKPNHDSLIKRSPGAEGGTAESKFESMCKGDECIDFNESPKTRLNMRHMCARKMGPNGDLSVTDDPDVQCQGLRCTVPVANGALKTISEVHPVPDGAFPCGEAGGSPGVCRGGKCIMNKVTADVLLNLDNVCRRKTLNQAAKVLTEVPEDLLCKQLKCTVPVQNGGKGKGTVYSFKDYIFPENAAPCAGEDGGMCVEGECVGVSPSRYDLRAVCAKNYPGSKLVQNQAPDECLKTRCNRMKDGVTTQYTLAWPPVDGSYPCGLPGQRKVCREGVCVAGNTLEISAY